MHLVYILIIGLLWLVFLQFLNFSKVHIKDKNYKGISSILISFAFIGVLLCIMIFIFIKPIEELL